MAARKTIGELRAEIVALISQCDYKDENPNAYIVKKNDTLITTKSFCQSHVSHVIVHASCDLAAFLVVLDHLNEGDQTMIYAFLGSYGETLEEWQVLFTFGEYFDYEDYVPEEFIHLHESVQGRSIKPAR